MASNRSFLLALCAVVAASAACADLFGFKDLELGTDAASTDASPEATPDEAGCAHARWPDPPDASPPGNAADFDMAMQHVYFSTAEGDAGGVGDFGYDLDDRCTFDVGSASCTASSLVVDDPNGRDNASVQLMATLASYPIVGPAISDNAVNQAVTSGEYTIVLRVLGLQSLVDQKETTGLQLGVQASPGLEGGGTPKFDGTDRWLVASEDCISPPNNTPRANGAYVSGGTLVSQSPAPVSLHVRLPPSGVITGTFVVTLYEAVLTGKLVQTDAGVGMTDGLIVGRWKVSDMLATLGSLAAGTTDPLCDYGDGGPFAFLATKVCQQRDIASAGSDDGTSACDAVSVAIRFDAHPAQVAPNAVSFPQGTTPCPHEAGACP